MLVSHVTDHSNSYFDCQKHAVVETRAKKCYEKKCNTSDLSCLLCCNMFSKEGRSLELELSSLQMDEVKLTHSLSLTQESNKKEAKQLESVCSRKISH